MKKNFKYIFYILFAIVLCIPILGVKALTCNNSVLSVENKNFICSGIDGTLSFSFDNIDYTKYFKLSDDGRTIDIDASISFPMDIEIATLNVKDSVSSTTIRMKNSKYVTTTTTTLAPENIIVVTFDKNDGVSELIEKKCSMINGSDYCSVVLPNINVDNFNGWGIQKNCKEGISGTVKVDKNITYYACYNIDEEIIDKELILKSLVVKDKKNYEEITFGELSDNKDNYDFKVLYDVEAIVITAVAEDEDVTVKVEGNNKLVVGKNEVFITLSDKNNNKKVYILNVERLAEGEPLEKIHYLSSLVIGGSQINFDKDIFEYNVTIKNDIEQLLINKEVLYENDTVTVRGNENLVNNSKVYIEVTGEDGFVTTYTINVFKEENSNYLFIILFSLLTLLIIVFVLIVFIKKRKSGKLEKEKKKNKEKIKKAKKNVNYTPEVLVSDNRNDDIEVLKF